MYIMSLFYITFLRPCLDLNGLLRYERLLNLGKQGQDDKYIRLRRCNMSHPAVCRSCDCHVFGQAFLSWQITEKSENDWNALISWNFLSTNLPRNLLVKGSQTRTDFAAMPRHVYGLARLVFFKAIWSKTIRFRLDLLRCCNINILRNLDVSVCGSWIKKEKPMATKATTLLLEASMVLEFPASSISWRR